MQSLDSLGAGFQLASHDLDIRGAGTLLGEEQSGHVREVGIELYQQLLEEAVAAAKGGVSPEAAEDWSPQITIGSPVLIRGSYGADLSVRVSLCRRIGGFDEQGEIDALAAELVDRFGALPREVENLLEVVAIKALCKQAGIEKVESGPKGAVVTFRGNTFANPIGLVQYVSRAAGTCKLRPDHKLVFLRDWEDPARRVKGLQSVIGKLAELVRA
jgi:transcription-repair coupling factor (superfamily II helicase)